MAELPQLGKHCSVDTCKQLDFLPFQCDGCGNIFCTIFCDRYNFFYVWHKLIGTGHCVSSDHRTKDDHNCSRCLQEKTTVEYCGPKGFPCDLNGCLNRELTPLSCEHCQKSFCLSHRHQQDHQCSGLLEAPIRGSKTAEHVKQILATKEQRTPRKPRTVKSNSTAAKVALMKLKMHAVGDRGVPDSERVYLNVHLPACSSSSPAAMFFSKKWSIGRVIDCIASTHVIPNSNNTVTDKKLRLSVTDGDVDLEVEDSLESQLGSSLFSGADVTMQYTSIDNTHNS